MPKTFKTIAAYADHFGITPLHPLLTVIDFRKLAPFRRAPGIYGFYAIILKEDLGCGALQYGLGSYDYQAGTILCVSPGQLFGPKDDGRLHHGIGRALLIHPDFLVGTPLTAAFAKASFFAYSTREALHLSEDERAQFCALLAAIEAELHLPPDAHSVPLLHARLDLVLHLLARFYERQFASRAPENRTLLARLETYLASILPPSPERPASALPTVTACAKALSLSPNYFGDLIHRETGSTAQALIAHAILARAKEFLRHPTCSIAQVAIAFGFSYPHHFTRFFRKYTGLTPTQFREKHTP